MRIANGVARQNGHFSASDALTIIVPTRNEAENVRRLLDCIAAVEDLDVDTVLFVDDSDDQTPTVVNEVGGDYAFNVELIHRTAGKRAGGLGGAVVTGLRACTTGLAVVMDGDLQHPPEVVPALVARAGETEADLVVASRYIGTGSADGLGSSYRRMSSKAANALVHRVFASELTGCSDPMSGFFLVRTHRLDLARLHPDGFKILMAIAVSHPELAVAEVPFVFGERFAGQTKAGVREGMRYLGQVRQLRRQTHRSWHSYQVHDHISVRSTVRLPELERFSVPALSGPADIEVVTSLRPGSGLGRCDLRYREALGSLGFSIALEKTDRRYKVEVSPVLRGSPHVLYTNVVEPILRWALIEAGFALVHAACIEHDGFADLITAQTDTGKTTTMLQILKSGRFRFMADDLMIASRGGRIWSYPKPLTISAHTLRAVNAKRLNAVQRAGLPVQSRIHSRSGRKVAFAMAKRRFLPIATVNTYVQMIVPPPKYHVDKLIESVDMATTAKVSNLYVIARGESCERKLDNTTAVETLLANCEDAFGFPPYAELESFLRYEPGRDLMEDYRNVVAALIGRRNATEFVSDDYDWADRIAAAVDVLSEPAITIDLRDFDDEVDAAAPEPTSVESTRSA